MLKWTLNKRIEPYAPYAAAATVDLDADRCCITKRRSMGSNCITTSQHPTGAGGSAMQRQEARELRRKSLATAADLTRRYRNRNKENLVSVASPHPILLGRRSLGAAMTAQTTIMTMQTTTTTSTPYAHRDAVFRDVANTTPQRLSNGTPTLRHNKRTLPPSPLMPRSLNLSQTPTLPVAAVPRATAEPDIPLTVEPAPASIALRGLTDSRYFPTPAGTDQSSSNLTPLSRRLAELRFSKISIQRHHIYSGTIPCADEEAADIDMSSKALNDTALDRMIDEILYSTRKPIGRLPKVLDTAVQSLHEQPPQEHQLPTTAETSPVSDTCQLRRQGGLRRKRTAKSTGITEQRKRQMDDLMVHHPYLRQSIEILAGMETPPKKMRWA